MISALLTFQLVSRNVGIIEQQCPLLWWRCNHVCFYSYTFNSAVQTNDERVKPYSKYKSTVMCFHSCWCFKMTDTSHLHLEQNNNLCRNSVSFPQEWTNTPKAELCTGRKCLGTDKHTPPVFMYSVLQPGCRLTRWSQTHRQAWKVSEKQLLKALNW